jgi:threonyl-tRNA synthetase
LKTEFLKYQEESMNLNYVLFLKQKLRTKITFTKKRNYYQSWGRNHYFCDHDTFTDLCRGGHIPNTGIIKAMKVMLPEPTGEVWRKTSSWLVFTEHLSLNKRFNRIPRIKSKTRDHRKLGKN